MTPGVDFVIAILVFVLLLAYLREGVRADRAEARLDVYRRRRERGQR